MRFRIFISSPSNASICILLSQALPFFFSHIRSAATPLTRRPLSALFTSSVVWHRQPLLIVSDRFDTHPTQNVEMPACWLWWVQYEMFQCGPDQQNRPRAKTTPVAFCHTDAHLKSRESLWRRSSQPERQESLSGARISCDVPQDQRLSDLRLPRGSASPPGACCASSRLHSQAVSRRLRQRSCLEHEKHVPQTASSIRGLPAVSEGVPGKRAPGRSPGGQLLSIPLPLSVHRARPLRGS
jgi:hypothetical protein